MEADKLGMLEGHEQEVRMNQDHMISSIQTSRVYRSMKKIQSRQHITIKYKKKMPLFPMTNDLILNKQSCRCMSIYELGSGTHWEIFLLNIVENIFEVSLRSL